MAFPTRLQVKQLYLQLLDDPAGAVFTDAPNPSTGAVSVFQAGFSQAYDLLFNNALNQQIPLVEEVIQGIIVGPSPVPFSVTPAQIGISSLGDWEWLSERLAGSNDKFIDLIDEDRLTQRAPTEQLLEVVWQNGAWQFVGCTTVRELQLKYVASSAGAPTNDTTAVPFDGSLNFLANYAAGVTAGAKGYDDIGNRCRSFAVGPKMDLGTIGGELFRLMQPLVRSRQNVQVAHRPYSTQRRILGRWRGAPWVGVQAGTTGGGVQNAPQQFSTATGSITPLPNGTTTVFYLFRPVIGGITLYRNGVLMTLNYDYTQLNNMITFLPGNIPQTGDTLTADAYVSYP